MKQVEILANFEREINKLDDVISKPSTDDSLYWLNQAVYKFCKTRFNGNLPHLTSYEQNEKRTRDLVNLFKEQRYDHFEKEDFSNYVSYSVTYPDDYMFVLNEDVEISDTEGNHVMNTCVFECTADSFMYRVNNSLTDFHYKHHRARPLRVRTHNGCNLLTDGKYKINTYTIGYLRKPNKINLEKPFEEYLDFPDLVMSEIIKIAAQMFIENQSDKRYQTITNEVNTQE